MKNKQKLTLERAFNNLEDINYPDDKRIKMLAFILKEIYNEVTKQNQTFSYSASSEEIQKQ